MNEQSDRIVDALGLGAVAEKAAAYLLFLLRGIVSRVDDVRVEALIEEQCVILVGHVHVDDMGYVIGYRGSTAQSIRGLLKAFGGKNRASVTVRMHEPADHQMAHADGKLDQRDTGSEVSESTGKVPVVKTNPIRPLSNEDLARFDERMGTEFKNRGLLLQALTHRSYPNECPHHPVGSYERLEFLGDAVIELVVTDYLYRKFTDDGEGRLSNLRAAIVSGEALGRVAFDLGLDDLILLSVGERSNADPKTRSYLLACVFESIVGAVYLDKGIGEARLFVDAHLLRQARSMIDAHKDLKTELQETVQPLFKLTPQYRVLDEGGPAHAPEFLIGVYFGSTLIAKAKAGSKKDAQKAAAKAALDIRNQWSQLMKGGVR